MASPLQNTLSTWHALFLRETLERLFSVRMGWLWLLAEPAIHIIFISVMLSVIRQRQMGGMDVIAWVIIGLLAFFLFRRTATQTMHSIDCNRAFFAFRQVRPFDTVFVRALVELYVMIFVSLLIIGGAAFIGRDFFPHEPLLIMGAALGLWSIGLGYGMVTSVIMRLVPETKYLLAVLVRPLYFISGVIFPTITIPQPYRDYILYNPLLHGVEAMRLGFFPHYNVAEPDLGYLYVWSLCLVTLGLVLYRVYEPRLVEL